MTAAPEEPTPIRPPESGEDEPKQARSPKRRRRRDTPFYSVLDDREAWELAQLADPSLSPEIGVLRLRVADLLIRPETDWKEILRAIEVLARMVRIQQGLPVNQGADNEALREFGRQVERMFKEVD